VTQGTARMQKMVILSPTRGMDCETDGHGLVVAVAMHCGESVVNWPFATALRSVSAVLCRPNWHHIIYKQLYVDMHKLCFPFVCFPWYCIDVSSMAYTKNNAALYFVTASQAALPECSLDCHQPTSRVTGSATAAGIEMATSKPLC